MDQLVQVLESTMAVRDPSTATHQQRVAQISSAIAREMELAESRISSLKMAARLHDFGKISIPMGILLKPAKLSEPEMAMVKDHPMRGAEMLKPLPLPTVTLLTIRQHHDRLNGSGYPFGLSGEDILLEARILGVADVVEAISSHRPYRASLGIEVAFDTVSQYKGILYDTSVVEALGRLYEQNLVANFLVGEVFPNAA